MKRDKLFRLSLAILFLWTSLALAAPAAMAASSTALPGSSLWELYLQQSRIDLEKAASSPWEALKSFLPRSFGALVRQTASRYTSVLLFLTLTAVLGLLAGGMHRWGIAGSGGGRRLRRPALGESAGRSPEAL